MTRRTTPPRTPMPARLTVDQMQRGVARLRKRAVDLEAFDPQTVRERNAPEVQALEASIEQALSETFGPDTSDYLRYRSAVRLDNGPWSMLGPAALRDVITYLESGKRASLALLNQAIQGLEEKIEEDDHGAEMARATPSVLSRKVFIVHGHDDGARESVARFLEKVDFEPVILHEQPNNGRTIIAKFQEVAADVGFAVVLLTPDDIGGEAGAASRPRARQNVILELGFFLGALGSSRVAALVKDEVERPSDFDGVVYIPIDTAGYWKTLLGRELQTAGYDIDWNKLMR